MSKARRRFLALAARKLEAAGESFVLWQVLAQLSRVDRSSQHDLAHAVGLDPPTISRLLDGLERNELVRRDRDHEDRRRVFVQLTQSGRTRLARMRPVIREVVDRCFLPLSHDECRMLRDILAKLVADDVTRCETARQG